MARKKHNSVEMNSIPANSVPIGTAGGRFFRAVIYRTPDGKVAAAVTTVLGAGEREFQADRMNSEIRDAAGGVPDYYVHAVRPRL